MEGRIIRFIRLGIALSTSFVLLRTTRLVVPLSFSVLLTACHADRPAPTTPTAPKPLPPVVTGPPAPKSQYVPTPNRPDPSADPMVGLYRATVTSGQECSALPENVRTRSYAAAIVPAENGYGVTLGDAFFRSEDILCGPNRLCNEFPITQRAAGGLRFHLYPDNDDSLVNDVWEWIAPGMWLQVGGDGDGRLEGSRLLASLTGGLWYVRVRSFRARGSWHAAPTYKWSLHGNESLLSQSRSQGRHFGTNCRRVAPRPQCSYARRRCLRRDKRNEGVTTAVPFVRLSWLDRRSPDTPVRNGAIMRRDRAQPPIRSADKCVRSRVARDVGAGALTVPVPDDAGDAGAGLLS